MTDLAIIKDVPVAAAIATRIDPGHRLIGIAHDGSAEVFSTGDALGSTLDRLLKGRVSALGGGDFKRFYSVDMRPKTLEFTYRLKAGMQGAYEFTADVNLTVGASSIFKDPELLADMDTIDRWMDVDLTGEVKNGLHAALAGVARAIPPTDDGKAEQEAQAILVGLILARRMLEIRSLTVRFSLDADALRQVRRIQETEWNEAFHMHAYRRQTQLRQIFEDYIPIDFPNRRLVALRLANEPGQLPAFIDGLLRNQTERSEQLAATLQAVNGWVESGKLDSYGTQEVASQLIRAAGHAHAIESDAQQPRLADDLNHDTPGQ